jgi:hypothetical protein
VTIQHPPADAALTAADGQVSAAGLTVTVRGSGPRLSPVFVNEAVVETDAEGRFAAEVTLEPGDGWLVAGMLAGCACVTQRVPVHVTL